MIQWKAKVIFLDVHLYFRFYFWEIERQKDLKNWRCQARCQVFHFWILPQLRLPRAKAHKLTRQACFLKKNGRAGFPIQTLIQTHPKNKDHPKDHPPFLKKKTGQVGRPRKLSQSIFSFLLLRKRRAKKSKKAPKPRQARQARKPCLAW